MATVATLAQSLTHKITRRAPQQSDVAKSPATRFSDRTLAIFAAALCALPMLLTAAIRARTGMVSGDEPHYLAISQALWEYGSPLDVLKIYTNHDYTSYYPAPLDAHTSPGPDGRVLPMHSIGGPLLWALAFGLWGHAGVVGFMVAVSALTVVNIYLLLRDFRITQMYAFAVSVAFGVGTPILLYAPLTFIEPIGALICVYVMRKIHTAAVTNADLVLSSVALGLLPWIHSRFILFAAVLGLFLVLRIYREDKFALWGRYIRSIVPAALLFISFEIYNLMVWHTLNFAPNQANIDAVPFQMSPTTGLVGIVLDQEAGILPSFPIFLLVIPGIFLMLSRQYLRLHLSVFLLVVPYTVIMCTFSLWQGAFGPPARLVVAVLPVLAVYVAVVVQRAGGLFMTWLMSALALWSLFTAILSNFSPRFGFNNRYGRNDVISYFGELIRWDVAVHLPTLYTAHPSTLFIKWGLVVAAASLAIWLFVIAKERFTTGGAHEVLETPSPTKIEKVEAAKTSDVDTAIRQVEPA